MGVSINVDATAALADLTNWEQSQIPIAMAWALNDTAVDFQTQEFLHEKDIFPDMRRPDWVRQANKLTHFANKRELWATITVSPPGAPGRSDIISKFEDQTEKVSIVGGNIAIPINVKTGKTQIILKSNPLRPKNLNFRKVGNRIEGDRGTFIVQSKAHPDLQLILQRNGKGETQVLYYLVPQVPITPDLDYIGTARWAVVNRFQQRFNARWQQALATGAGGSALRAAYTDDPVAYLQSRGYSIAG